MAKQLVRAEGKKVLTKGRAISWERPICRKFQYRNRVNLIQWEEIRWVEHCGSMVQVPGSRDNSSFICNEQEVQGICAAEKLEDMLRLR